jgi:hypothetical protein
MSLGGREDLGIDGYVTEGPTASAGITATTVFG